MGRLVVQDLGLQVEGTSEPLAYWRKVFGRAFLSAASATERAFGSRAVRGVAMGCIGGSSYSPEVILPIEERRSLHGMHPASASLARIIIAAGWCASRTVICAVDVDGKAYDVTQGCRCRERIV